MDCLHLYRCATVRMLSASAASLGQPNATIVGPPPKQDDGPMKRVSVVVDTLFGRRELPLIEMLARLGR